MASELVSDCTRATKVDEEAIGVSERLAAAGHVAREYCLPPGAGGTIRDDFTLELFTRPRRTANASRPKDLVKRSAARLGFLNSVSIDWHAVVPIARSKGCIR